MTRVPGNFHIEARSALHNLNPKMANLSHVVNHLSFGPALSKNAQRRLEEIPNDYFNIDSTQPMNGFSFVNAKVHQAFHHYIKVDLALGCNSSWCWLLVSKLTLPLPLVVCLSVCVCVCVCVWIGRWFPRTSK